jgi:molybdate transport system ATP-binding protein
MLTVDIRKRLPEFSLNVSFTVDRGILAILGRSGSGKTMTLKCIAGLVTPDRGHIALNDRVLFDADQQINLRPQQRNTGFVFQNYALFPNMTCYENIAFGIRGAARAGSDERVASLMERLRIAKLAKRYPRQLSGGQQQRVALARALAVSPDVLLLDEPFSALDTFTKDCLQRLLLDVEQFYSGYVLLVTHNVAEAYRLSSRIAVYEAGELLQIGPKQDILSAPVSATAASVTGVRNLWDAVAVDDVGDRILVELPGTGVRLWARRPGLQVRSGQSVAIGIRSEELRLLGEPVPGALPGTVVRVIEEVASCTVLFSPDATGMPPKVQVTTMKNGAPLAAGDRRWLEVPEDKLLVMPGR